MNVHGTFHSWKPRKVSFVMMMEMLLQYHCVSCLLILSLIYKCVYTKHFSVDHGLSKHLPKELRLLTQLQVLNLNGNSLTGTIPTQIGRLGSLVHLDLGNNFISGSIPSEIGMMTSLEEIIARNNHLGGVLPSELSNIPNLNAFWVDRNNISGDITAMCEASTGLIASADCGEVICPCCSICCYDNSECVFSTSFK
jgi:hypothetical protein